MVEWPKHKNGGRGVFYDVQMDSNLRLGFKSWTTPKSSMQEMLLRCLAKDEEVLFDYQGENMDLW